MEKRTLCSEPNIYLNSTLYTNSLLVSLQKVDIIIKEAFFGDQLEWELNFDTVVAKSLSETSSNQNEDCVLDFFKANCFKFVNLL
jgi:hypothetical protein